MNLIEDSFQAKKKDNSKKIATIILVIIAILILFIIGILSYLAYLQNNTLKVYVNGQQNSKVKDMLVMEDDGTIYVSVRDIASYLGYQSYSGEYTDPSEDASKCYVINEDEVANITLNSKKIYKTEIQTSSNNNYEYYYIKKPVKAINGKLYISTEGMEKAFNASFYYDEEAKKINIYTLPYLISSYETKILDYGYETIDSTFVNKKAVLNNILIVTKNKQFGVIDLKGNTILEAKYSNIEYMPNTGDFLVTSNANKVGVISKNRETKVQLLYDKLILMDSDVGLYLAEKDRKYGVVDLKGNIKIYIEFDEIGMDINAFEKNEIKNKYILVDNLIPVRKDKKWGLFDKNGKQVVDFEYDRFGYIASSNKNAINLLVIPDYNILVAGKDKKYTLLNAAGEPQMGVILDDVYMEITSGQKHYYMNANNKQYNVTDYLDEIGVKNVNNKSGNTTKDNKTYTNATNQATNNNTQNKTTEKENSENEE